MNAHRVAAIAVALLVACGRREVRSRDETSSTSHPVEVPVHAIASTGASSSPSGVVVKCARDEGFPSPWPLPEASAAAEVELRPGVLEILAVSDSGRRGVAMAWSPAHGMRTLTLPLDAAASDDVEGMAWIHSPSGGRLYTLTSSGAVRVFASDDAGGLRRDGATYRIGAAPLSCPDLQGVNCGKNWEGLCLRNPATHARCAGYAASKAETALYCVDRDGSGRLAIETSRPPLKLDLDRVPNQEGVLSDCAFGSAGGPAENVLLVTTNVYGGSTTYVVDENTGHAAPLDVAGTMSNEAIAVDSSGALIALMDDNGETSMAERFVCAGWGR